MEIKTRLKCLKRLLANAESQRLTGAAQFIRAYIWGIELALRLFRDSFALVREMDNVASLEVDNSIPGKNEYVVQEIIPMEDGHTPIIFGVSEEKKALNETNDSR